MSYQDILCHYAILFSVAGGGFIVKAFSGVTSESSLNVGIYLICVGCIFLIISLLI